MINYIVFDVLIRVYKNNLKDDYEFMSFMLVMIIEVINIIWIYNVKRINTTLYHIANIKIIINRNDIMNPVANGSIQSFTFVVSLLFLLPIHQTIPKTSYTLPHPSIYNFFFPPNFQFPPLAIMFHIYNIPHTIDYNNLSWFL